MNLSLKKKKKLLNWQCCAQQEQNALCPGGEMMKSTDVSIRENVKPALQCCMFFSHLKCFCVVRTNCHVRMRKSDLCVCVLLTLFNFMAFQNWQEWSERAATLLLNSTLKEWHWYLFRRLLFTYNCSVLKFLIYNTIAHKYNLCFRDFLSVLFLKYMCRPNFFYCTLSVSQCPHTVCCVLQCSAANTRTAWCLLSSFKKVRG